MYICPIVFIKEKKEYITKFKIIFMKKILLLATLFLTCFVMNGQTPLNINDLKYGDNAPYEDGSVTFQSDWESAGWGFMTEDGLPDGSLAEFTDFQLLLESTCEFEFQVKVKYYSEGAEDPWTAGQINNFVESENIVSIGKQPGIVSLGYTDPKYGYHGPEEIMAIYIQDRAEYAKYPDPAAKGTVFLASATLQNNAKTAVTYYQFEVATPDVKYPSATIVLTTDGELDFVDGPIAPIEVDGAPHSIATIVPNGKDGGNAVEVFMTNYNQALKLPITLPAGTTVADIESVQVDLSMPDAAGETDLYKDLLLSIDGKTITGRGVYGQIVALEGAWKTNEIRITPEMVGYADVKDLNKFDLYLGANVYDTGKAVLYDNVKLVIKGKTDYTLPVPEQVLEPGVGIAYVDADSNVVISTIDGGIEIESDGAKTTVYSVDGTLVASTFDSTIYLQKGLYLVKVGTAPVAKVIVK
jgi:hypothetical protein